MGTEAHPIFRRTVPASNTGKSSQVPPASEKDQAGDFQDSVLVKANCVPQCSHMKQNAALPSDQHYETTTDLQIKCAKGKQL